MLPTHDQDTTQEVAVRVRVLQGRLRGPMRSFGDDRGFSMMEAIVAALLLAIGAAIVAALLINVLQLTTNSGRRTAAANLAASKLEAIRQMPATAITDGQTFDNATVGNTVYTITQEATYQSTTGVSSACATTSGSLAYKRVTIKVTWPGMGNTKPVQSETLRALGFDANSGGLDATKGALAVQISDNLGAAVQGATVNLRQGSATGSVLSSQVTGADGCVVFTDLTAGVNVYPQALKSGYVSRLGLATSTDSGIGVTASTVLRSTLYLADSASAYLTYSVPAGVTNATPYIFGASGRTALWTPSDKSLPACPVDGPCLGSDGRTVNNLFPGDYSFVVGSCTADTARSVGTLTSLPAGSTTNITAPIGAVRVTSTSSSQGTTVTLYNRTSGCTSTAYALGAIPASPGYVTFAVPAGTWQLRSSGGGTTNITVAAGGTSTAVITP